MNGRQILIGVAAVCLLGAFFGGGYLIGARQAPSEAEASDTRQRAYRLTFEEARAQARAQARKQARARGLRQGRERGRAAGRQAGGAAGDEAASTEAERSTIEANVQEAEAVFDACADHTPGSASYARCITGSGVPTGIQPGDPPADECPPGYHFDPSGGDACLPD
jgi:hypothetical protein